MSNRTHTAAAQTRPAVAARCPKELVMVTERQAQTAAFGTLMMCPAHAHGTPDDAEQKLRLMLGTQTDQPATLWICRSNQSETLMRFAPLVERVVVNPFSLDRWRRITGESPYWPGSNHPLLNEVREVRRLAGNRQLLACVNLEGEPALFGRRAATFAEIEWQVYAALGTGFQGLVWRGDVHGTPRAAQLRALEGSLRRNAEPVILARPVDWACTTGGQPASALYHDRQLFVVLLSGSYMNPDVRRDTTSSIRLPLEDEEQHGELHLTLPAKWQVVSATTLRGKPLVVRNRASRVEIPYRFRTGGEMIICALSEAAPAATDSNAPTDADVPSK